MEERINSALKQIEKDLQTLNSSRQQVESIVNSNKEFQGKVQVFVNEVANLSHETEKLISAFSEEREKSVIDYDNTISSLKETSDKIVSDYRAITKEIEKSFKDEATKLHTETERFVTLNNSLRDSIDIVNGINNNIEKLMSELKNSQAVQDGELSQIKTDIAQLDTKLTTLQTNLNAEFQQTNTSIAQLDTKLSSLQTSLNNELGQLNDKVDKLNEAFVSEVKKNRKAIIILGAIILISVIVLRFI